MTHTTDSKEALHTQWDLHWKQLPCEVHKQRHSGIGNVGYGYAILQPLINTDGEYKGQIGGYHVIADQDLRLPQKDAETICASINSCYQQIKDERQRLIDSNTELLAASQSAMSFLNMTGSTFKHGGIDEYMYNGAFTGLQTAINNAKNLQ